MATEKKVNLSKLSEVGPVLQREGLDYHYRSVTMADGACGLYYGDEGEGPENPKLLVLDYLLKEQEPVQYVVRPNRENSGNIMWIILDKDAAAKMLEKYRKAETALKDPQVIPPPPPVTQAQTTAKSTTGPTGPLPPPAVTKTSTIIPPPPATGTPLQSPPPVDPMRTKKPAMEDVTFPKDPPPPNTVGGGGKKEDDPWLGYGSRDAMFRAKDGHFERLERNKIARDAKLDVEFRFDRFLKSAVDIVKETGKNLQPSDFANISWTLAIDMYNRFLALQFNENGQIVNDGPVEGEESA